MELGYELIKEQLFFRKELIERVYWFIKLRWIAVGVALTGSWAAYLILGHTLPIIPLTLVIFCIFLYNCLFYRIWRRLEIVPAHEVRSFTVFANAQIALDLIALYFVIYFTGGIYSPLLIFVIFHIILAGILLSPLSCFIYGLAVLGALGGLIILQMKALVPLQPIIFHGHFFPYSHEFPGVLVLFLTLTTAILVSAFLITSIKKSLRTKGRELLKVSKELEESNAKLTALYEMIKEMGLHTDLQALMDSATRNAARIMGVKGCSIKLLDDQKRNLRFASTYGLSEDYVAKGTVDIEKSSINRKIIQGSFYAIGEIDEKDYFQYPEDIKREGIASMICLPLRVEKMIIGVYCVYSDISYYFEESDIQFFSLMADLTALAIENLRSELNKAWFVRKAAHQLRSPLSAVDSMLKAIRERYLGAINEKQEEIMLRCEKRLELLEDLISDLLKLETRRTEAGRIDLHPVNCEKVVRSLVALYRTPALEKGLDIQFSIQDSLAEVLADEKLLDELFSNLISNAIKYTPRGGQVKVDLVQENQDFVRFEVSDTGIGISEKDRSRLYTEFFRAEGAKNWVEEGTGLGLAIVKEILDRLKGTITVKSTLGEGTCFTCLLPCL